jgi:GT2 family glycosyltransferase
VRYFHKTNSGPAGARNVGFRHAQGDYVALLDSDDAWQPWKLDVQIACMERRPDLGMTWTDMEMVDASGQVADPAYLRKMYSAYRRLDEAAIFSETIPLRQVVPAHAETVKDAPLRIGKIFTPMVMGNLVHTSTVVLRRERLERVGGFDESLRRTGEDYDFHLRTCREGPVGLLDLPAIRYQQGMPDRLTAPHLRIHMAENLLRTIEPVIAHDREKIALPDQTLRRRLAQIHAWIGYERLERGEVALARKHLLLSLRQWPNQPALAKPLLFAMLPGHSGVALRRTVQALRTRVRGAPPPEDLV